MRIGVTSVHVDLGYLLKPYLTHYLCNIQIRSPYIFQVYNNSLHEDMQINSQSHGKSCAKEYLNLQSYHYKQF